jgi:DNA-binding transcriptional MerR regulator
MTGERLVSAAEAARLTGIPAGTIRHWAARQRLFSVGLDKDGRPLYRLSEIKALRAATRRRRRRSLTNDRDVMQHP